MDEGNFIKMGTFDCRESDAIPFVGFASEINNVEIRCFYYLIKKTNNGIDIVSFYVL